MPRANWMSDEEYRAFERCVEKVKKKGGVNPYAVCMASIKEHHEKIKGKVLKKLGEQRKTHQRR